MHINFNVPTFYFIDYLSYFFNIWLFAYFYTYILYYIVSTNHMHFYEVLYNSVKVEISFSKVYR